MIDKIYKKDNYENQQIFHDIEQAKKYSNYSIELNQTFGDKSYDRFYKSLIEHKKARGLNFMSMFQKPKNATGLRMHEEPFNIKDFKSALKTMKKKNDKLLYRIKNPYKSRKITKEKKENEEENEKKAKSVKKMINTGKKKRMEKSQMSNINKANKRMKVLVKFLKKDTIVDVTIKSNEIICSKCKEPCLLEIEDYKIKLYKCKKKDIQQVEYHMIIINKDIII